LETQVPAPRQIDTWQAAELNAAAWMRYWGYDDAVADPGGADGGVDIRATRALGQVKYQGAPIGRPALQQLVGARKRASQRLLFFTGSSYSKAAREYADEMHIGLMVYDPWGRMSAANPVAERILRLPARRTAPALVSTQPSGTPSAGHLARHWAAWVGALLVLAPFATTGLAGLYTGPSWLDIVKFTGVLAASWTVAGGVFWLWRHSLARQRIC
jgi:hypothetical protein